MKHRMRGNYLFGPVFFIGILAGISVPAYHDYTVRAQATEGLALAGAVKVAVTEYFAEHGKWPRDLRALQFTEVPRGEHVTFVAVNHGTVVIRYSSAAAGPLRRQQVTLRPSVSGAGDVSWSCAYAADQGADPPSGAAAPHATSLPPKYLPRACRG